MSTPSAALRTQLFVGTRFDLFDLICKESSAAAAICKANVTGNFCPSRIIRRKLLFGGFFAFQRFYATSVSYNSGVQYHQCSMFMFAIHLTETC